MLIGGRAGCGTFAVAPSDARARLGSGTGITGARVCRRPRGRAFVCQNKPWFLAESDRTAFSVRTPRRPHYSAAWRTPEFTSMGPRDWTGCSVMAA